MYRLSAILLLFTLVTPTPAAEPNASERGYKALTGTAFSPGFWKTTSVENAWKQWDIKEKPADYDAAFRDRYGLHPAPYLHNGSVPTLHHVLNSTSRPRLYTRSFKTDVADYDKERVGWKITELKEPPSDKLPAIERRRVYDTTKPGRSNAGHTFGDALTDEERAAVVEYLKTL